MQIPVEEKNLARYVVRPLEWRPALITFLVTALIGGSILWRVEQYQRAEGRKELGYLASIHAAAIQRSIENALSATYPLAALVRQAKGIPQEFESLAEQMLPMYEGADSLQLAPGGVIERIVPLQGNEKAIGHKLLVDPAREKEAFRARDTGLLTLAGPFNLLQGGVGVVGRLPVYLGPHGELSSFWGFVTVLIRFPEVLSAAKLDQFAANGHAFELWRTHPDTGQRHTIASSGNAAIDPVILPIMVPNATWNLSVAPVAGWMDRTRLTVNIIATLIFSALLGWIASLLVRDWRHRLELESRVDEATRDLRESEMNFRTLVEEAPFGVALLDRNGSIPHINKAFTRLLGYTLQDVPDLATWRVKAYPDPAYREEVARTWREMAIDFKQSGNVRRNFRVRRADGHDRDIEFNVVSLQDRRLLVTFVDVTERKSHEIELMRQAHIDYLTGVSNRGHFMAQAELERSRALRYHNKLSLLMIDIDFFKNINDSHGHHTGDLVIKKLVEVCRQTLRDVDVIGRVGGEEFAILLPQTDQEEVAEVAERLRKALDSAIVPLEGSSLPLHFTVSIGVVSMASKEDSIDVLLNLADKALYEAKRTGRNKCCIATR